MLDLSGYRLFGLEKEELYDKYFNRLDNIVCESDGRLWLKVIKKMKYDKFHIVNNKMKKDALF